MSRMCRSPSSSRAARMVISIRRRIAGSCHQSLEVWALAACSWRRVRIVGWGQLVDAVFVGDDPPAVQRLQRVVMGAEPPEVLFAGRSAFGDGDDVVDLQALVLAAAGDPTTRVAALDRAAQCDGDRAFGGGDLRDLRALAGQQYQLGVAQQRTGDSDRDRADAFELALFTREHVA